MEHQIELWRIAGGVVIFSRGDSLIIEKAWGWKSREEDLSRLYTIKDSTLVIYTEEDYGMITPNFPVSGAMTYYSGGAGLTSSTSDYLTVLSTLHIDGAFNGTRLLEESTVDMMTSNLIGELEMG